MGTQNDSKRGGPGNRPLGPGSGKPRRFTEEVRLAYLVKLAAGVPKTTAAYEVGVTPSTVWDYINAHPEFADQARLAMAVVDDRVEEALMNKALGGDVIAAQVWLYNRRPSRWQDRRKVVHVTDDAINAEIESLKAELERFKPPGLEFRGEETGTT